MVARPLLERYCTIAMRAMAPTKVAETFSFARFSIGPRNFRRVITVRKVEQAIIEALKRCTWIFLVTRNEEQTPAAAATRMAASPPQNRLVSNPHEQFAVLSEWKVGK